MVENKEADIRKAEMPNESDAPERADAPDRAEVSYVPGEYSRKKKYPYCKADGMAAILILLGSWFYVRGGNLFWRDGLVLFSACFLLAGAVYLLMIGRKMTGEAKVYLAFIVFSCLWLYLIESPVTSYYGTQEITPYVIQFLHIVGVYWLLTIAKCRIDDCLNENGVRDLGRGFFVLPFMNFYRLPDMVIGFLRDKIKRRAGAEAKKDKSFVKQMGIGILVSLPVLVIVLPLLAEADESFELFIGQFATWCVHVMDSFLGLFSFEQVLLNVLILIIGCYLLGLFYGSFHTKPPKAGKKIVLSVTMLLTFSTVICGVYLLFFAVKFVDAASILFSANPDIVYSDFARQGFFELCYIVVINFCIFYGVKAFADESNRIVKIALSLLGIETLGFITLAFSKMSLYISVYGFTFKRVFTSWFMGVLFFTFILLIQAVWKKFNAIRIAVLFASVTFLLLAYSNIDVWMAKANLIM